MSATNRAKRPDLTRSEPIRSWSTLLGPPSAPTTPDAGGTAPAPGAGPAALGAQGVSRGVQMGYQVIEEYIRQGQRFAQGAWSPAGRNGNGVGGPLAADPAQLMTRMYQYASDLASAWLEYVQVTTGAAAAMRPPGPAARPAPGEAVGGFDIEEGNGPIRDDPRPPAATTAAVSPAVAIDITSRLRTEVLVDLRPGPLTDMEIHDLRAADPALPRITGSRIDRGTEATTLVVRIVVPDGQPPGTYSGLIVDGASNLPRGTLSLRLQSQSTD